MTTLTSFVNDLSDLTVTGVAVYLDAPPAAISDLPVMWPQLPEKDAGVMSFGANDGWPILRAQLVIAYEGVNQDTLTNNFSGTLSLLDAASIALNAARICKGKLEYTLKVGTVTVAGINYWAITADVTGKG